MNSSLQVTIDSLGKTLWDYHKMNFDLEPTDICIGLGSKDTRVAIRAAEIYKKGLTPLILFSGGLGKITKLEPNATPEAIRFAQIALQEGVPKKNIIIEDKSTNTGENIEYSYKILQEKVIEVSKIILVTKPYMERRSYATFMKQWPAKAELYVTSPQLTYEEYCSGEINKEEIINLMVGDLQRIKEYPPKGFQIEQVIPEDVWQAYEELVKLGFDEHVMK